ncbi:hypothetical protein EU513_02300 [Yimella sp. RIT 621]|uniref:hypothetical protein n=1 Tax=Yimella sp. RIT 621 TaxID=2510323 RepID=UPI00101DF3A1|nr:hypothetical protein [Yimella sp. RIT 621]RYG78462.1 hypothetical protein EU513_02300 [Yimella sp. RIT 621]
MRTPRSCARCGKPVPPPRRAFCSDTCRTEARRARDAFAHAEFRQRKKRELQALKHQASLAADDTVVAELDHALEYVSVCDGLMQEGVLELLGDLLDGIITDEDLADLHNLLMHIADRLPFALSSIREAYAQLTGVDPS